MTRYLKTLIVDAQGRKSTAWIPEADIESGSGSFSFETPTGEVNGVNDTFVFSSPPIFVTYQGVIQNGGDYTLVASTVTFNVPPVSGSVQGLVTV